MGQVAFTGNQKEKLASLPRPESKGREVRAPGSPCRGSTETKRTITIIIVLTLTSARAEGSLKLPVQNSAARSLNPDEGSPPVQNVLIGDLCSSGQTN